ncbi:TetR/AcrR family transcriptional regulator [Pontibacterium granulatum]|uniref:TetR/AcrR family transcriptional regulator n=1 Tax=Pontibacterium granulatum TaxID=2036029 RepID=UPI00249A604B|nr:TetR/AcrR family transcriptional regulator [Pontibacterium granulatum]MDI3324074.1 TetR/AcrR family transcriptional regulator [Pontibacterium granulatum]
MPWSPEQKKHTRERILASAAKLFTQQGFDHVGINEVMADAGLTRGAFYAHFSSKAELYAESITTAARLAHSEALAQMDERFDIEKVVRGYLGEAHRCGEIINCPLALLITDIGQRDVEVRDTYTQVFKGVVGLIEDSAALGTDQGDALRKAVLMIGGMAISRAISDEELATQLLEACREGVLPDSV